MEEGVRENGGREKENHRMKNRKNEQKNIYIMTNSSPNVIMTLKVNDLNTPIDKSLA